MRDWALPDPFVLGEISRRQRSLAVAYLPSPHAEHMHAWLGRSEGDRYLTCMTLVFTSHKKKKIANRFNVLSKASSSP